MVNKIKLLEDLNEKVFVLSQEMCLTNEEVFYKNVDWLNKATSLMQKIYDEIKDKFPGEEIIKIIRDYYEDNWDVLYPFSYEDRYEFGN